MKIGKLFASLLLSIGASAAVAGAPTVSTNAPSAITDTTVQLNATVNPNGENTAVSFNFGVDVTYGGPYTPDSGGVVLFTAGSTPLTATVTGLDCSTEYHYRMEASNASTSPVFVSGSDQVFVTTPCAPTITSVSPGDSQATVYFTPGGGGSVPVSPGGYKVTSNPGNIAVTGSGSPITVAGLINSTPYTFTVTATNSGGTSSASGASSSVTPNPAPAVVNVAVPTDATYTYGQNLDFTVTWDSNVTVTGTPQIAVTLNTGGTVFADYVSSPTPTTMLFRHTLGAGKVDLDGVTIGALGLNSGSIQGAGSGIDASLTLNAVGNTTNVLVDSTTPSLPAANIVVDNQLDPQLIILSFVTGHGGTRHLDAGTLNTPSNWLVTSNNGAVSFVPATVTLTGSNQNIVRLTLPATDGGNPSTMVTNVLAVGHIKVTPPATLADVIGNPYVGGLVTESGATHILDTTPPTISAMSATSVTTHGATLSLTTSEKVRLFWIAVPVGSAAPTEAQVKAGVNYGAVTVSLSGVAGLGSGAGMTTLVSGLASGSSYVIYAAANDAAGNAAGTVLNTSVVTGSPTPPTPPTPPANPFNPGGSQASGNLDGGSGITPTPAPPNLITNTSQLGNQVGISDNGVVVVLSNDINQPIKFQDNPPSNVLITMPSQKPVDIQVGGSTLHVQLDPETTGSNKSLLNTATLTLPNGTQTSGLQLTQGQASIGNSAPNGVIGGLELSNDSTLRDVVAQGGSTGGTAGFAKLNDGSGSVSADAGEILVSIRLKNTSTQSLARASTAPMTLTLQAGEVARFDSQGDLKGVYLGSVSGAAGKSGDPLAVVVPAGVATYPTNVPKIGGANTLGRTGGTLEATLAQQFGVGSVTQGTDGVVQIGTGTVGLPLGNIEVAAGTPDGTTVKPDGSTVITHSGLRITYVPALANPAEFAASLHQSGFATSVRADGVVQLQSLQATSIRFVARPGFQAAPNLGSGAAGQVVFSYQNGKQQVFKPAFVDQAQMIASAATLGLTVVPAGFQGELSVRMADGSSLALVPDFYADIAVLAGATDLGAGFKLGSDGRLYYTFGAFVTTHQGFGVR